MKNQKDINSPASADSSARKKSRLHARNRNRERYDIDGLIDAYPEIKRYIVPNKYGEESIEFSNPAAVKYLNKALLSHYYGIKYWDFPEENLVPPIPGRADYIHYIADLLCEHNMGTIPTGDKINCLDVGVGASCIYPIIGVTEYGWRFIGSDVDAKSIESAQNIVDSNPSLKGKIDCRLQDNPERIFEGILSPDDKMDLVICNPPFHSSLEEAQKGTRRKVQNLTGKKASTPERNFAGISNELIYEGGEYKFAQRMIEQSRKFGKQCYWFSTLVSKQSNHKAVRKLLERNKAYKIVTIPMGTGNKSSRIAAWTFLNKEEQKEWRETRWKAL